MTPATNIKERLFNLKDLPTIPDTHQKILKLIENINYSVDEVGRFIEMDQVLSTKVLKLVNSPFYGLYSNVASIKRAIVLLGANLVKGLVLSTSLFDMADESLPGLWDHSYCCSTVSGFLARKLNLITIEEIMTGALLHDLGKVLVRKQLPEEAKEIDLAVGANSIPMIEAEKMVITYTHDEVGLWLADKWNLPKIIKDVVAYHHKPGLCVTHPKEVAIVHLSDIIVKGIGISYSADRFLPAFDGKGWDNLGLAEGDLADLMTEIIDMISADKMFSKYIAG